MPDTKDPSASCCNNTQNLFTFKPGAIQAIINGDGTNRLGPYVAADEKTVAAPTSISSTGSEPSSSNNTSVTTMATAAAAATAGDTGGLTAPVRDAIIAMGVVLGTILLITLASLAFVWRKLSEERRLRREAQRVLKRQQEETWPQITHPMAFQTVGSGVTGGSSEMYTGDREVRELPTSQRVGELST